MYITFGARWRILWCYRMWIQVWKYYWLHQR